MNLIKIGSKINSIARYFTRRPRPSFACCVTRGRESSLAELFNGETFIEMLPLYLFIQEMPGTDVISRERDRPGQEIHVGWAF